MGNHEKQLLSSIRSLKMRMTKSNLLESRLPRNQSKGIHRSHRWRKIAKSGLKLRSNKKQWSYLKLRQSSVKNSQARSTFLVGSILPPKPSRNWSQLAKRNQTRRPLLKKESFRPKQVRKRKFTRNWFHQHHFKRSRANNQYSNLFCLRSLMFMLKPTTLGSDLLSCLANQMTSSARWVWLAASREKKGWLAINLM